MLAEKEGLAKFKNGSLETKELKLYPIDYPFETLVSRIESKKLILNPDFQRKYKWDKHGEERTSKFIESCLMRIPLPNCYFYENEERNHEVIDGLQRITTIQRFFNNEFSLENLTVFKELNGKKFEGLEHDYKRTLENYTIRCIILRQDNFLKGGFIQDIFARLNQGGVSLTNQEVRHALFPGSLDKLLSELAKNEQIKNFGEKAKRKNYGIEEEKEEEKDGLEAEEQVLRFFAMRGNLDDYESNLAKYLDNFMENNKSLPEEKIEELKKLFNETLEKCVEVFGTDEVFRNPHKQVKKQGLNYYDLLMWSFQNRDKELLIKNKETIKKLFKKLCESPEFEKTLSGGLQVKTSVKKRRDLWENKLASINE